MVRLSDERSADRLPIFSRHCLLSAVSIHQLDKVDICSISSECNSFLLSDGLAGYTFPLYNSLVGSSSTEHVHALCLPNPTALPSTRPAGLGYELYVQC